ncbi:MAG: FAD-dependent oxidoreductase [Chthonomonadales bacterium]
MDERVYDVVIVGASLGGVSAAWSAARQGARVLLLEASGWIGGQLTGQGVCTPDENAWVEDGGASASYRELRRRARAHYMERYRLSEAGKAQGLFNPGNCWVSRISAEPKVWMALLHEMLREAGAVDILLGRRVVAAEAGATVRVRSVTAIDAAGCATRYRAPFFLDATDTGDLLPLAGVEFAFGAEARDDTGEPHAPAQPHPDWVQPLTFPVALELRPPGENHTIPKPPGYEELIEMQRYHILDGAMQGMFGAMSWWTYRRILAAENFEDPAIAFDVAMINTAANDFRGGIYPTGSELDDARVLKQARRATLGYVYWLQTECPRADDASRRGYPEFRLRADLFDTPDGVAPLPYIRESRRIRARTTVYEQEIVQGDGAIQGEDARAVFRPDACGIGHYWLDIHEGPSGEQGLFLNTRPFQIPLGALIPVRVENLLPACKNLGVTHLANGAFRLHPVEWAVGEAAGLLAAFCASRRVLPREVLESPSLLERFQSALLDQGVPLYWWGDLPAEHPAFRAAQRLAMAQIWPVTSEIEFRPDSPFEAELWIEVERRIGRPIPRARQVCTRSEAAQVIARALE